MLLSRNVTARGFTITALLLLVLPVNAEPVAVSSTPLLPDSGSLAVRCGAVLDGLGDAAAADRLIIIRDGRISQISAATAKPPADIPYLDLADYTCLPGLIDTHVHLDIYPEDSEDYRVYLQRTPDDTREIVHSNAAITLNAGFTSVRHLGSYLAWIDRDTRNTIASGSAPGPRIQPAGFYLTIPHGGGDMYIPGVPDEDVPLYYRRGVTRGVEAFREKTQELIREGAEVIKVIASGAVFGHGGVVTESEVTEEEIAAIVEVAHAAGVKVTAHAHGAKSIKEAIRAGVDSIEHASLADDEAIALAADRQVAFSMDVYNGTYTAQMGLAHNKPEAFLRKNEQTTEAQRIVFEKAYRAGVPILYGTDAGIAPHGSNARQFSVMVKRGMSAADAIKAATSVAADHMGWQTDVGALEVGRYGDLIAVRGNPLENVSVLESVKVVVKGGLIFKLPE